MKKSQLVCLCLFSAMMSFGLHAQEYVPGEVIVRLKSDGPTGGFMGKAVAQKGLKLKESWEGLNMHHFTLSKGQTVESAVADLKKDPDVLYAEPNYIYHMTTTETGLHQTFSAADVSQAAATATSSSMATGAQVDLQSLWARNTVPSQRPIVAIIDTGVDTTHPVFQNTGALWRNTREIPGNGADDDGNGYIDDVYGWNFVDNSPNMIDDEGHGTHVAGIVLSVDQNIFASPLRASRVQIMPLKFMDAHGSGATSNAIRAIYYAVNNGATILNNSWGGPSYSSALNEAIAYSYSKGTLFIAAAGNASNNNDSVPTYPANYDVPNVLSVAATTDRDALASFSNYGVRSVPIGSPGVYILSTLPGNSYGTMSGTSMATPFVAGTAAQMKIESPKMLGFQMKEIMTNKVVSSSDLAGKVSTTGRIDMNSSVQTAKITPVKTTQPAYAFDYATDRELASAGAAASGGCGGSKSMQNGNTPFASIIAIVTLLLAQLAGLVILRYRAGRKSEPDQKM